jgi:hypothetical protein
MTVRRRDIAIVSLERPAPQAGRARGAAQDVLAGLRGSQPGVMLVGTEDQTAAVIGQLLPLLTTHALRAVGLCATDATPDELRHRVGKAHAATDRLADLLLIVAQAQSLSDALLCELDQAAEAASMHGGLKILLVATEDLASRFTACGTDRLGTAISGVVDLSAAAPWPDDAPADRVRRRDIVAGHLQCGAPGVTLIGASSDTAALLRQVSALCPAASLLPVPIDAAEATIDTVRAAAATAHADAAGSDTGLLLVVENAQALSEEVLLDLDLAASAASRFGGLQFLFASTTDLEPRLAAGGALHLRESLSRTLVLDPQEASRVALFSRPADRSRRSAERPRRAVRTPIRPLFTGLAAASFAGLSLTALLSAGLIRTMPAPLSPPPPAAPDAAGPAVRPVGPAPGPERSLQTALSVPVPAAPSMPDLDDVPAPEPTPTAASLLLLAQRGDTLQSLYKAVYRDDGAPPFAQIAALNPVVRPGTRLVFPPPAAGWPRH